jgi:septal ring factor EnvC (AmiA/AmiB activator)
MSLIKSSSSSTLPKLSIPKPTSPKRRARSKTRPEEPLIINLPPELEDLETQIHSKRRTLDLLSSQLPPIDSTLQDQILSRDRLIASLNRSILESSFMSQELIFKQKNWTTQIDTLETQLEDLKRSKHEAEARAYKLEDHIETLCNQWETDKNDLVFMQEALKEENDQLKVLISSRDAELSESDKNI